MLAAAGIAIAASHDDPPAPVARLAESESAAVRGLRAKLGGGAGAKLDERAREVLRLRYGLSDGRPRTPAEVGLIFNVSRERIRVIEAKALRMLRGES